MKNTKVRSLKPGGVMLLLEVAIIVFYVIPICVLLGAAGLAAALSTDDKPRLAPDV